MQSTSETCSKLKHGLLDKVKIDFFKKLKNYLEMNDEDDEFVDLFDDLCYIDGGNQSGFYLVEEQVFETR